ncbi:MAG: type-F conjugative transfer system pilin assembly protein TrbC [Pseudomonadota bacterium]
MRSLSKIMAISLLIMKSTIVVGGEPTWPDIKSIDAARNRTKDAFSQMPAPTTAGKAPAAPVIQDIPSKPAGIDMQSIANQYQNIQQPAVLPRQTRLLVFVSLSMPQESLKRLAEDAARANAVLVLRGLVNDSMQQTLRAVKTILGEKGTTAWEIDPPAFIRYGVAAAPTYVLARHANDSPGDFVAVEGDVTLGYALNFISRQRPAFSVQADEFRGRLGMGD